MAHTYIGQRVPRIDSLSKVCGQAIYNYDRKLPGMLYGKIKRSTQPFARIVSIDTSMAWLPGVKAVITAADVKQFPFGLFIDDELPLADKYVRFVGEEVAAVAAIDEDTAAKAVKLIKVEYEPLTPVFDPLKAIEEGAPAVHPELKNIPNNCVHRFAYERGEGARGFNQADVIVEDTFTTPPIHQAYLEPQACVSSWDMSGRLSLWASFQSPFRGRVPLAKSLGITEDMIRIRQSVVGGGFGGRGGCPQHLYPISALLARATGKPVRIALDRKEEFIAGRPRISNWLHVRLGFKKDGTMVAKEINLVANGGAYSGYAPAILNLSGSRSDGLYRTQNIKVDARLVYTNTLPRGSMRGIGFPQVIFALESLVDEAAEKLGVDPVEIRRKNYVKEGEQAPSGWILNSCKLHETIKTAVSQSGWDQKQKPDGDHVAGMASAVWISSRRGMHPVYDGSAAIVNIDQWGKVRVISGEMDIGQGSDTIFAQIAAQELDVPIADVQVLPVDSDYSPYALGTWGSRVTTMGGNAVLLAAKEARNQLYEFAARKLGTDVADVLYEAGMFSAKSNPTRQARFRDVAAYANLMRGGAPISGNGTYVVPDYVVTPDKASMYGNDSVGYPYATQVADVSVDRETGQVELSGLWHVSDSGRILNPMAAEGQLEGGMMQGVGFALMEGYIYNERGEVVNSNLHDYKIPTAADLPSLSVTFADSDNPGGPYGGKGIAEIPCIPTAAAIANAVKRASGVRMKDLPITPEKMLRALEGSSPEGLR